MFFAFDGDVNLLKGALMTCDAITAVSPTYAQELRYSFFAHGMESVIQRNAGKVYGVLNGIDMDRYDPSKGEGIQYKFSATRAVCQSLQWITSGIKASAGSREIIAREKNPYRSPSS